MLGYGISLYELWLEKDNISKKIRLTIANFFPFLFGILDILGIQILNICQKKLKTDQDMLLSKYKNTNSILNKTIISNDDYDFKKLLLLYEQISLYEELKIKMKEKLNKKKEEEKKNEEKEEKEEKEEIKEKEEEEKKNEEKEEKEEKEEIKEKEEEEKKNEKNEEKEEKKEDLQKEEKEKKNEKKEEERQKIFIYTFKRFKKKKKGLKK